MVENIEKIMKLSRMIENMENVMEFYGRDMYPKFRMFELFIMNL